MEQLSCPQKEEKEIPTKSGETQAVSKTETDSNQNSTENKVLKVEESKPAEEKQSGGVMGSLYSYIGTATATAQAAYDEVKDCSLSELGQKVRDKGNEVGEQIKSNTQKLGKHLQEKGNEAYESAKNTITTNVIDPLNNKVINPSSQLIQSNIVDPSKKILESELVQTIKNKTTEGISTISNSEFVKDIKDRTNKGINYMQEEYLGKSNEYSQNHDKKETDDKAEVVAEVKSEQTVTASVSVDTNEKK